MAADIYGWAPGDGEEGTAIATTWVVKFDQNGTLEWQKTFGLPGAFCSANTVRQTADSGFIMAGALCTPLEPFSYAGDLWVVKLDAAGVIQWQRNYGGPGEESAYSIIQTPEGGYVVAGKTSSFGPGDYSNAWVLRLNPDGFIAGTE